MAGEEILHLGTQTAAALLVADNVQEQLLTIQTIMRIHRDALPA